VVRAFSNVSIFLGAAGLVAGAADQAGLFLGFAGTACASGLIAQWWAYRTVLRTAPTPDTTPHGD
jgi:hypothetical protein